MKLKRAFVKALNTLCGVVDFVAYRPAVVKLTRHLPVGWHCQFARWSMALDDRWGTGFWDSSTAPPAPSGLCAACGGRAAWLEIGGFGENGSDLDGADYLANHTVRLCGYCSVIGDGPFSSRAELEAALRNAAARSVRWGWSVKRL